jgi:maltose/moltooligosaccharide transporter
MAAGALWILDASINISMEPFRALVADKLPDSQRSYGFVVQTLIIGIGTWVASNLPWMMTQIGIPNTAAEGVVPDSVKYAFAIGALVLFTSILYTILKTDEYPPEDLEEFEREKSKKKGFFSGFGEIMKSILDMPRVMKQLGVVQFFSWFAFFTMWSMATPALTEHVFKAPAPDPAAFDMAIAAQAQAFQSANAAFQNAADQVGSAMGVYGLSSMAVALLLSFYAARFRLNCRLVHFLSLTLGGIGFLSMFYITDPSQLKWSFALIGVAWASILSMPYALLSSSVDPNKMGVMMGLFNMFIVLPQIAAALGGVNAAYRLIGPQTINAMTVAGMSLIIGGLLVYFVQDNAGDASAVQSGGH